MIHVAYSICVRSTTGASLMNNNCSTYLSFFSINNMLMQQARVYFNEALPQYNFSWLFLGDDRWGWKKRRRIVENYRQPARARIHCNSIFRGEAENLIIFINCKCAIEVISQRTFSFFVCARTFCAQYLVRCNINKSAPLFNQLSQTATGWFPLDNIISPDYPGFVED